MKGTYATPWGSLKPLIVRNILPAARSTTPRLSLPSSATNSRRRFTSMARWSIRPLTPPSGIFPSSTRGGLAVWAEPAVGSVMIPRRRIARANITPSALGDVDMRERRLQPLGELLGIVIGPEVHEIEAWLVVEHVVVDRRDFDPVLAERFQHRVHFAGDQYEVAGDRRFAAAGRLKVDRIGRAHWWRDVHPIVLDRFRAGNAELVDAAIIGALGIERLIDGGGVEIDLRRWRRGSGREGRLAFRERSVERGCKLHRLALAEHMHVHCERLIAQKMIVQCCHLDSACRKPCHDRGDLVHGQYKIAHDHALIAHLLEGEPAAERKAGLQLDTVERDLQIGARQADPVDATRRRGTGLPKRLADARLPVVIGCEGEPGRSGEKSRKG